MGYALCHAYGAVFDNPDLIAACIIGDGEAETGPLAASWHSNKFLNPVRDGAVLPILHLNEYKIGGPTVLARLPREELELLLRGNGHVAPDNRGFMHETDSIDTGCVLSRFDATFEHVVGQMLANFGNVLQNTCVLEDFGFEHASCSILPWRCHGLRA